MKRDGGGSDAEGRLILARGIFRLRRRRGARNTLVLGRRGAIQQEGDQKDPGAGVTRLRGDQPAGAPRGAVGSAIPVEKWQALGNDFLLVWDRTPLTASKLAMLCHRHRGVGADGVLFLQRQGDSIRAQLFNADGSPAEYSGNGLRCVVASAVARQKPRERLLVTIGKLIFEGFVHDGARSGVKELSIKEIGHKETKAEAASPKDPVLVLDPSSFGPELKSAPADLFASGPIEKAFDRDRTFCVKLGNPHLIFLVDDLAVVRAPAVAAELDRLRGVTRTFPAGINVSVAQQQGAHRFLINTWERGVGPTAACASAATALFHLLRKKGLATKTLTVTSPGGSLTLSEVGRTVHLKGPARRVFQGMVDPAALEEP